MIFSFFWALVLFSYGAFSLYTIFLAKLNKFIIMIIMINITVIDTYSLKYLIPKKLKLLEMNIDYKLKFGYEL